MYARYLNAPLLLLLWQIAPLRHRDDGRFRLSVGAGTGEYSFQDYGGSPGGVDCAGEGYGPTAPYTESATFYSRGVAAEAWPHEQVRVHAAFGDVKDEGFGRTGDFFAFQTVWERRNFGLGLGIATLPGSELEPSLSARVGLLDAFSLRADYRQPGSTMGLMGGPRVAVGWNQGTNRRSSVLAGLATTPGPDSARRAGAFLELSAPLGFLDSRGYFATHSGFFVTGFLSGMYHGNEDKRMYSVGLGFWLVP